jgi:rhodanese-related sulfurtransferase
MAGFMIENIAKGTLKQWHLEDVDKISKDKNAVLLDVRTVGEFSIGFIDTCSGCCHIKHFDNGASLTAQVTTITATNIISNDPSLFIGRSR